MGKKVLHICMSEGKGGMELYVERICSSLIDSGWKVYGITLKDSKVSGYMKSLNMDFMEFSSSSASLFSVFKILRWMNENDVKIAHCHKSSDLRLAALIKMLAPGIRFFFTDHVGGKKPKKDVYHRFAYGSLERVFSISGATHARNIINLPLPEARISKLYHGIDIDKYSPNPDEAFLALKRKELGVPDGCVLIGLPGRVTPGKGHETWVKALGKLPRKSSFYAVAIGGTRWEDGGVESFAERLVAIAEELGIKDKLAFLGSRSDLHEILPVLDIVCIPSKNEAFGLTVIESMAAGSPVIGSNAGSIPELLGSDSGLLAEVDNPDDWAKKLSLLINDRELRSRIGLQARRCAVTRFSQSRHVSELVRYYEASRAI